MAGRATFVSRKTTPGTIAVRLDRTRALRAVPETRTIVVRRGGGLSSGVPRAGRRHGRRRVTGSASASPAISPTRPTASSRSTSRHTPDVLAGNLEPGSITVYLIRQHFARSHWSDEEIVDGIRPPRASLVLVVEGSLRWIRGFEVMPVGEHQPPYCCWTKLARDTSPFAQRPR